MENDSGAIFGFEKLDVWQRAVGLANCIYSITRAFPREEMFGLTMQMRRAGVSVAANIAEGVSRTTGRDQARFLEIAYGSVSEIITMLRIAACQGFAENDQLQHMREDAAVVCKMLSGLRRSALER